MVTQRRSIFIIGDSISIQYGPFLKEIVKVNFTYDRKRGVTEALTDLDKPIGANGGDSSRVLQYLLEENFKKVKYDILLINCGLHDIRVHRQSLEKQINEQEYEKNLNSLLGLALKMANKVVWINSTPIADKIHNGRSEGFFRFERDLNNYNSIAEKVLKKKNIELIDLYSFTKKLGENIYCDHVHFKEHIRKKQAAYIAENLNRIL